MEIGFTEIPEIVFVSGGGTGTTSLISHVERYRATNSRTDRDGLKHLRRPFKRLIRHSKIVFIKRDYEEQVTSLERRDFLRTQLLKLVGIRSLFVRTSRLKLFAIQALETQEAWFRKAEDKSVLFLQYPHFFDSASELSSFLEISDPSFIEQFPEFEFPGRLES
jgi:hypothetical protein